MIPEFAKKHVRKNLREIKSCTYVTIELLDEMFSLEVFNINERDEVVRELNKQINLR